MKNREIHLRTIIETIPDLVWLKDTAGIYLSCNPKFERFFGAKAEEIIGKTDYDFVDKTLADFFRKKDKDAMAAEKPSVNEEEIVYAEDGHKEVLETVKTPMYDAMGNIVGILGVGRDITLRKQAETALQASKEKFSKAFKNAPLLMTISSLKDGRYLDVNEAFLRITGYAQEVVIGSTSVEIGFISKENRDKLKQKLTRKGYIHEIELELKKADGSPLYCLYSGELITVAGKQRLLSLAMDITERKKVENRRQQTQKMESIGSLAGGIAHDFNNILTPIVGMSELLLEDLPPQCLEHENVREILKAGIRGADLVRQILAFSRQSEHKLIPVRIEQIFKEVLKLSRATIPSDIEIVQEIQTDCGLVMADPTQIHQVGMNIVTNAFHAVEAKGGVITVGLEEILIQENDLATTTLNPGKCAHLWVSDNGHGMKKALMDKIFEPYFTTKAQGKGTGLGLAVVYGIIKEHKGDIQVESEAGKGTIFHILIPIMEKEQVKLSSDKSVDLQTGKERILLVDDEEPIANLGAQMLSRLGYKVTSRTDSQEALELFKSNPNGFDLIVTDMAMPHMTGDRLAQEILSIKPGIPVIICTGFSERMSEAQAGVVGIKGFLMKPVVKSELAQMVRKVLDE